nr:hypothetical protein [Tanacetum cinerariifolium]
MKRIKRDIALLETEIKNTEEERNRLIETSFLEFRSAFQAIASAMLPNLEADLTLVGSSIVDHGFQICYTGTNIAYEAFNTRRLIGISFLLTMIHFLKGTFFMLIERGVRLNANQTLAIHNTLQTHLKDVQVVVFSDNAEAWITGNVISCWASSSSEKLCICGKAELLLCHVTTILFTAF